MEDILFLQGAIAARQLAAIRQPAGLPDVEFKVFSQWGEDGIIEWLVSRLPGIPQRFIELGVQDFRESNCRFLLQHRNWRGLIMDGSAANMAAVRAHPLHWRHDLSAVAAFITRDNIDGIIRENQFPGEIGILSIDLDGNDYWILDTIHSVEPWIVICEYNAVFGDALPISVPYDEAFVRENAHHSYLYWGTSVAAIVHWAKRRGYVLLGSNRAGNNAFLVREDLAGRCFADAPTNRAPLPSRYRESRDAQGRLSFAAGLDRLALMKGLPVVDVSSGETLRLEPGMPLYSDRWLAHMQGRGSWDRAGKQEGLGSGSDR
ncbi:hypothetical protein [Azospirillum sp.]|uniref:hypothetical protein n=1 Tax=Azospirillum sp. TaxID=34012 RepID=UPI003D738ECC